MDLNTTLVSISSSSLTPVLPRRNDTTRRHSLMESSFLNDISEIQEDSININDELNGIQNDLSRISQQGRIFDTTPSHIDEVIMQDVPVFTIEERNEICLNDKIIYEYSSKLILENYLLSKCETDLQVTKNNKIWTNDVKEKIIDIEDWDYIHHEELILAHKKL